MATTARLGIDIVGTNRTAAAFSGVQRGLSSIQRSMSQLKVLAASVVGGEVLAKFVRGLVAANRDVPEVKTALDRLTGAWTAFAQKVGDAGMNQALVNVANRLGALISGSDGLASSIGRFMAGAITGMGAVLEGVGRSVAFVYDNAHVLARFLAAFAIVAFAQKVLGAMAAFIYFAQSIRATGMVMAAFSAISRSNLVVFMALAAGVAYATGSVDQLKAGIDKIWNTAKDIFPEIAQVGREAMEGLGFDMGALSDNFVATTNYLNRFGAEAVPVKEKVDALSKSTKKLGSELGTELPPSITFAQDKMEELGSGLGDKLSDVFGSIIDGSAKASDAFRSMAMDMLQQATRLALNGALSGLFQGVSSGGALGGFLSNVFGGFRAGGGSVSAGRAYVVGERGPELFMPSSSGAILPNGASGRSGNVNVTVINQSRAQVETSQDANGNPQLLIRDAVRGEISRAMKPILAAQYGITPKNQRR